jgi:hypothetical protein
MVQPVENPLLTCLGSPRRLSFVIAYTDGIFFFHSMCS